MGLSDVKTRDFKFWRKKIHQKVFENHVWIYLTSCYFPPDSGPAPTFVFIRHRSGYNLSWWFHFLFALQDNYKALHCIIQFVLYNLYSTKAVTTYKAAAWLHIVQCTKAKFTNIKRNMCGAVNMVYMVYTVHLVYMVYMVCTVYKEKLVWRYVHGLQCWEANLCEANAASVSVLSFLITDGAAQKMNSLGCSQLKTGEMQWKVFTDSKQKHRDPKKQNLKARRMWRKQP